MSGEESDRIRTPLSLDFLYLYTENIILPLSPSVVFLRLFGYPTSISSHLYALFSLAVSIISINVAGVLVLTRFLGHLSPLCCLNYPVCYHIKCEFRDWYNVNPVLWKSNAFGFGVVSLFTPDRCAIEKP